MELTPKVGDVVIVEYASKSNMLSYMGVIQSVIENQYQVHLKKVVKKPFTLKEGDCDVVSKNNIASTIKNVTLNTRGQYLVDSTLSLDMWFLMNFKAGSLLGDNRELKEI